MRTRGGNTARSASRSSVTTTASFATPAALLGGTGRCCVSCSLIVSCIACYRLPIARFEIVASRAVSPYHAWKSIQNDGGWRWGGQKPRMHEQHGKKAPKAGRE